MTTLYMCVDDVSVKSVNYKSGLLYILDDSMKGFDRYNCYVMCHKMLFAGYMNNDILSKYFMEYSLYKKELLIVDNLYNSYFI